MPDCINLNQKYWQKVLNIQKPNIIALWRLNERSGNVVADSSPEGNNGVYTGVDLANAVGPDDVKVPFFDAINDSVNVYSTGLAADFNGSEGTMASWAKVTNASVWTDGIIRFIFTPRINASNYISIYKRAVANSIGVEYMAGGTYEFIGSSSISTTDWFHVALVWSKAADSVTLYLNGTAQTPATTLGNWTGSIGTALIGSTSPIPTSVWNGWLALTSLWNVPLSASQISEISQV